MNRREALYEYDPEAAWMTADGFDEAIIGIAGDRVAYSKKKCIRILVKRDKMTEEEAWEYFSFNVEGAYMGEQTPIWIDDTFI